jgi:hypothetical protein
MQDGNSHKIAMEIACLNMGDKPLNGRGFVGFVPEKDV